MGYATARPTSPMPAISRKLATLKMNPASAAQPTSADAPACRLATALVGPPPTLPIVWARTSEISTMPNA